MTSSSQPTEPEQPATDTASSAPAPRGHGAPTDPRSGLRASHTDREAVAERLREAAGDGRLDLDELEERLELAFAAKTYGELAPLTADLPSPFQQGPPAMGPARTGPDVLTLKGGMHGAERVGRWQVPSRIVAKAGLGGVKLDFTRADIPAGETEIEMHGDMGGVTVIVPEGWRVDSSGCDPSMGGLRNKVAGGDVPSNPNAPIIWVTGSCGMGGVTVRNPNRWERRRLRDNPA
ncbi:DUF1707 SHOCT-like domain-containing protein [Streptomyces profundus]|uniref:DUF1707 SHOCT-like domain-containing protein n=1 Tax=Streptomyces profundus TaxID=2867410 RepID=UPI002ADDA20E|nr:DUF1707 domain-containing protein [Streptomyces sp. MA3_2.13]UED84553.1 DUF1707 domain-containing protein [Streptomyces sp. MA3_2.13]